MICSRFHVFLSKGSPNPLYHSKTFFPTTVILSGPLEDPTYLNPRYEPGSSPLPYSSWVSWTLRHVVNDPVRISECSLAVQMFPRTRRKLTAPENSEVSNFCAQQWQTLLDNLAKMTCTDFISLQQLHLWATGDFLKILSLLRFLVYPWILLPLLLLWKSLHSQIIEIPNSTYLNQTSSSFALPFPVFSTLAPLSILSIK